MIGAVETLSEVSLEVEQIEVDLLLEGIKRHYNYDFLNYSRPSVIRRLHKVLRDEELATISALQARVMHDSKAMSRLIDTLSVNVTAMFRDAAFFKAFRERAISRLRTYPYLRFWVAGCSTGEEAYSLAILLHEEGLLERSRIYATDFSGKNIKHARMGSYDVQSMRAHTRSYIASGGQRDFSTYYAAKYDQAKLSDFLARNISFAQHNLVTDQSFNEFHVIFCRNVMIYFDRILQERVMHLFQESLAPLGFLCLGSQESIFPTSFRRNYKELGEGTRLFQLV